MLTAETPLATKQTRPLSDPTAAEGCHPKVWLLLEFFKSQIKSDLNLVVSPQLIISGYLISSCS